MNNNNDLKILEAILFASSEPITESDLKEKIQDKEQIKKNLKELQELYSNRGVNLVNIANGWAFRTSPELADKLVMFKKQTRKLSRAALETLAIIAYHQPITRPEIEEIRGVQMGKGSIDNLMEIGWIKPKGRKNAPGRPTTWGTTSTFLEHFEIDTINDLPNKEELKASGFLEKKSALATISEIARNFGESEIDENEADNGEEDSLEDFISENK